ncbi:hypothetical protein HYV80_01630 [Candidatus Woesearchaeota archaeon]|nr:hypothetical protein [Candidatus Woesearchaeota archaeon]
MIHNKKASELWVANKILFWIIFGIVLGFSSITFVYMISKTGAERATVYENLESLSLLQRFLKSPDCFTYGNEENALYLALDYEKFNDEQLNKCYSFKQGSPPAYRITLTSESGDIVKSIKTANWNINRDFEEKRAPANVMIRRQDELQKGRMEIETQNIK